MGRSLMLAALTWDERLRALHGVMIFLSPIVTYLTLRWAWSFTSRSGGGERPRTPQRGSRSYPPSHTRAECGYRAPEDLAPGFAYGRVCVAVDRDCGFVAGAAD